MPRANRSMAGDINFWMLATRASGHYGLVAPNMNFGYTQWIVQVKVSHRAIFAGDPVFVILNNVQRSVRIPARSAA